MFEDTLPPNIKDESTSSKLAREGQLLWSGIGLGLSDGVREKLAHPVQSLAELGGGFALGAMQRKSGCLRLTSQAIGLAFSYALVRDLSDKADAACTRRFC